jgi:hypothetical protein
VTVVAPPPPAPPPVVTVSPWYADVLGDSLVAGGVISGVLGLVFYHAALGNLDQADTTTTYAAHEDLVDSAHSDRTIAVVLGAGGVALAGVGIFRLLTHDPAPTETRGVAIAPTANGGIVTWTSPF